ncbi:hypothetical protein KR009_003268 [Drosophila setifemur]|nr:hypothetical protein KR009_003268 [Drosophila setifemur]
MDRVILFDPQQPGVSLPEPEVSAMEVSASCMPRGTIVQMNLVQTPPDANRMMSSIFKVMKYDYCRQLLHLINFGDYDKKMLVDLRFCQKLRIFQGQELEQVQINQAMDQKQELSNREQELSNREQELSNQEQVKLEVTNQEQENLQQELTNQGQEKLLDLELIGKKELQTKWETNLVDETKVEEEPQAQVLEPDAQVEIDSGLNSQEDSREEIFLDEHKDPEPDAQEEIDSGLNSQEDSREDICLDEHKDPEPDAQEEIDSGLNSQEDSREEICLDEHKDSYPDPNPTALAWSLFTLFQRELPEMSTRWQGDDIVLAQVQYPGQEVIITRPYLPINVLYADVNSKSLLSKVTTVGGGEGDQPARRTVPEIRTLVRQFHERYILMLMWRRLRNGETSQDAPSFPEDSEVVVEQKKEQLNEEQKEEGQSEKQEEKKQEEEKQEEEKQEGAKEEREGDQDKDQPEEKPEPVPETEPEPRKNRRINMRSRYKHVAKRVDDNPPVAFLHRLREMKANKQKERQLMTIKSSVKSTVNRYFNRPELAEVQRFERRVPASDILALLE